MLKICRFIFLTEMALRWRRSQEWVYPLAFFIVIVSLFPMAFSPDPAFLQKYLPGCIWIAALLASLLSLDNIFYADLEEGHIEQLLLSPLPLTTIISIKLCVHWLIVILPFILLTPLLGLLFQLPFYATYILIITLLLGTPILILIGSLAAVLTLGLRQQGVLLGILMLPLVTPVLIFGATIVEQSQTNMPIIGAIAFLAGLSLLSLSLLPWCIALTLRVSLDQ